jgi:UDP-arabinose 4-epimerase
MNVLVTGGAGYIGSHTAKALARSHYQPIAIDDLSTGHAHNVKWGPFVRANLSDTAAVRSVLREHRIQAVVHFAGSALLGESVTRPLSYFQNNVGGTLSLLEAMLEVGVRDIIFSSTCATYGMPTAIPITEDQPQKPINPYGDSKLAVERVLQWMGLAQQIRWVALRYFNDAGADPDGELSVRDSFSNCQKGPSAPRKRMKNQSRATKKFVPSLAATGVPEIRVHLSERQMTRLPESARR